MDAPTMGSLLKANDLRNQGRYQEAIEVYQQLLRHLKDDPALLATLANSYFSMALENVEETGEHFQRAVDVMRRAISIAPNDGRLHAMLGSFYALGLNDYISAAAQYRQAVELSPNEPQVLFDAASLYGLPDNVVTLDEAIDLTAHAAALAPQNPTYLARLAELYTQAGRMQQAADAWRGALLCPTPYNGPTEAVQQLG